MERKIGGVMKNANSNSRLLSFIASAFILSGVTSANATLVSRLNGQAAYDTDLNITWLSDANLAVTNTFGVAGINVGGYMSWNTAQSWIAGMNAANYLGFQDWRLPLTPQPDSSCDMQDIDSWGPNCTGSEMGHLFYNELGGMAFSDIALVHNAANYSLFTNIQSAVYWSGTEYAYIPGVAWEFGFLTGVQATQFQGITNYILAVRTGDVAAVPLPAAFWLFGSGLIGFFGFTRRRSN